MIEIKPDIALVIALGLFILGVIIGISWYKIKYASRLSFGFWIEKEYGKKPNYIVVSITNRGMLAIPFLHVYMKHWPDFRSNEDRKFYFKEEEALPELKPGQFCRFKYPLTTENGILLDEWKSLIDNPNYILLFKVGFENGPQIIHSARLAKVVVAQILYHYSQDFAERKYWRELNKNEKKMYWELVESRAYNHYGTQKKIYRKLMGRDELRKVRYTFSM